MTLQTDVNQIDYCSKCEQGYQDEERLPPCRKLNGDGLCSITLQPPLYLAGDNNRAWDLYREISDLSGADANGLPTLTMIDFVFHYRHGRMTQTEFDLLLLKIRIIHNHLRNARAEKISQARKQADAKAKLR